MRGVRCFPCVARDGPAESRRGMSPGSQAVSPRCRRASILVLLSHWEVVPVLKWDARARRVTDALDITMEKKIHLVRLPGGGLSNHPQDSTAHQVDGRPSASSQEGSHHCPPSGLHYAPYPPAGEAASPQAQRVARGACPAGPYQARVVAGTRTAVRRPWAGSAMAGA